MKLEIITIFMLVFTINIWGVLLAAAASIILGMLWYGPLFGKPWMKLVGMTKEKMDNKAAANKAYAQMIVVALITSWVLALFLKNLFVPNIVDAMLVGFFVWFGFQATVMANEYIFNVTKKPWALYILTTSYQLVSLVVSSAIIFLFMR